MKDPAKSEGPGCISPAPARSSCAEAHRQGSKEVLPGEGKEGKSVTHEEALAKATIAATLSRRKRRDPFPMTGGWIQKLTGVGEHRALRLRKLMIAKRMIVPAGSYRQRYRKDQPSGWRVTIFTAPTRVQVSVRRRQPVKPWWKHPLFGLGLSEYPGYLPGRLRT